VAARVPAATLDTAPAFRRAAPRKPEPAAAVVQPRDKPAVDKPKPGGTAPVPAAAVPPPSVAPASVPAAMPAAPPADPEAITDADLKKLDQARRTLAEPRLAKDLKAAFELARGVADAHPGFKEAQHLAAEGAYRISRWSDAAAYFRRGGDPGEEAPERLFYLSVVLYESGDAPGAATALKRALPNLKRTPYVDSYVRKILSQ
jgi:hypothetical protein